MADRDERPQVRTVTVEVPSVSSPSGIAKRDGANIDDVVRAIIWDFKEEVHEWSSWAEAARHLGVPQQTLSDFMNDPESGTRILTLSRICAALQMSPVDLLQLHERYHPESRGDTPFAADVVYNRFRALLDVRQASRLARMLELAQGSDLLEKALDFAEAVAGGGVSASDAAELVELSRRKR